MAFKHSSLYGNSLRLLQPTSTTKDALQFRLVHVPRESTPGYTAVSYTWGNEEPTEIIYLNGQVFHVTPNLWSCLYYLSVFAKHHAAWDYIWVDAVCIDQSNDLERNAQVRFMDATYRDSVCASVWLGLVSVPESYKHMIANSREPIKLLDCDPFDWSDCMDDLANRPYWSRYWVIQEFLLAQNVDIFCSGNLMHWLDFKHMLGRHAGVDLFSSESYDAIKPNGSGQSFAALPLVANRHPDRFPDLYQPLYDLLVNHRGSQCKDPRDRIFALLGLVRVDDRKLLQRFFPDYRLSVDSVVIITLGHLIQFDGLIIIPDSDDLFLGLGVESKRRRSRLISRANRFDYCGSDGNTSYLQIMESEMEWESMEGADTDETIQVGRGKVFRSYTARFTVPVMILVILSVVFWIRAN